MLIVKNMTAVKWNRTVRKVHEHNDFTRLTYLLTYWLTFCPPAAHCLIQYKHLYSAVFCGGLWWCVVFCSGLRFQAYRSCCRQRRRLSLMTQQRTTTTNCIPLVN